jgi:gamma-glutamylputrescine oxidase
MQYASSNSLSFWEQDTWFDNIDVAIIGAGLVGLSAAIELKRTNPALKVLVLERGSLPSGASTKNAGFACFGSASELLDDLNQYGEELTWETVAMRWKGLKKLRSLVGDQNLAYEGLGGYEVFRDQDSELYEACMEKVPEFNRQLQDIIGVKDVFQQADPKISSFGFKGGARHMILNTAEGQIHTGKMVMALWRKAQEAGVLILTGLSIASMEKEDQGMVLCTENNWKLKAGKVLLCTNGLTEKLLPELEVIPARNQVLITKPISGLPIEGCFHYDKGYFYLRNIGNRILIGGGRHLAPDTEQTSDFGITAPIQAKLRELLDTVFLPGLAWEEDYWWSGILGIGTSGKKPIIRWIDEHLAVAVRMGGMGVAIGSLVGAQGAELVSEAL